MKIISDYGKFDKFKSLLEVSRSQSQKLTLTLVTLTEAFVSVQRADLASVLDRPGPITVFAPSSSAFDTMAEGHLQYLSSAEVRTSQTRVLTALNI